MGRPGGGGRSSTDSTVGAVMPPQLRHGPGW
jgi:hypothetical protein